MIAIKEAKKIISEQIDDTSSTHGMMSVYSEDGRFTVVKDSRSGERNYAIITNLTLNDIKNIKNCIEDILKKGGN